MSTTSYRIEKTNEDTYIVKERYEYVPDWSMGSATEIITSEVYLGTLPDCVAIIEAIKKGYYKPSGKVINSYINVPV